MQVPLVRTKLAADVAPAKREQPWRKSMHTDTPSEFYGGEPWCRDHERPLRECLAALSAEIARERYRERVREVALLLIGQGFGWEQALEKAAAFEARLGALKEEKTP
jgi:hypothetical protein